MLAQITQTVNCASLRILSYLISILYNVPLGINGYSYLALLSLNEAKRLKKLFHEPEKSISR